MAHVHDHAQNGQDGRGEDTLERAKELDRARLAATAEKTKEASIPEGHGKGITGTIQNTNPAGERVGSLQFNILPAINGEYRAFPDEIFPNQPSSARIMPQQTFHYRFKTRLADVAMYVWLLTGLTMVVQRDLAITLRLLLGVGVMIPLFFLSHYGKYLLEHYEMSAEQLRVRRRLRPARTFPFRYLRRIVNRTQSHPFGTPFQVVTLFGPTGNHRIILTDLDAPELFWQQLSEQATRYGIPLVEQDENGRILS
jgi:hypothetical protein